MFTEKIQVIEGYIHRCDEIASNHNYESARQLENEITGVFQDEIPLIYVGLDGNSYPGKNVDHISNIAVLKAKLLNYKANITSGFQAKMISAKSGITVNASQSQKLESTVSITLEQTVDRIMKLSESDLSADDKDILAGKLASISASQDPLSRWEKAKVLLKWLADKGIEVGIAALPYIVESLKK